LWRLILGLGDNDRKRAFRFGSYLSNLSELRRTDENFRRISTSIDETCWDSLEALSEGRIFVPIGLGPGLQTEIMGLFKKRMDAVSHNDLQFWAHIYDSGEDNEFDGLFGREYYSRILEQKRTRNNLIVTRIFLLSRQALASDGDRTLLAKVIDKHCIDGIAVALAFTENFTTELRNYLQDNEWPQEDFALFDGGQAATFFRGRRQRKFEVIFRHMYERPIERQLWLHKTLIIASVFATANFEKQIADAHPEDWEGIKEKKLGVGFSGDESLFKVKYDPSSTSPQIDEIKERLTTALAVSGALKTIYPLRPL
jgi:hypothetical protein